MDDKLLSLELRTDILRFSLLFENQINELLANLLFIDVTEEERKAISHKSGNLSINNKLNLLFDLGILTEDEHRIFLLLTEYRNQFLHNFYCNSFTVAASFLGNDKKNRLLKYSEEKDDVDLEKRLANAYKNLYLKIIEIILQIAKKRKIKFDEENQFVQNQIKNTRLLITEFNNFVMTAGSLVEINESDLQEVRNFKSDFASKTKIFIDNILNSDQLEKLWNHEELCAFIKSIHSIQKKEQ